MYDVLCIEYAASASPSRTRGLQSHRNLLRFKIKLKYVAVFISCFEFIYKNTISEKTRKICYFLQNRSRRWNAFYQPWRSIWIRTSFIVQIKREQHAQACVNTDQLSSINSCLVESFKNFNTTSTAWDILIFFKRSRLARKWLFGF